MPFLGEPIPKNNVNFPSLNLGDKSFKPFIFLFLLQFRCRDFDKKKSSLKLGGIRCWKLTP